MSGRTGKPRTYCTLSVAGRIESRPNRQADYVEHIHTHMYDREYVGHLNIGRAFFRD